ncbi:glycoside hydrolase family 19 protein [Neopusillimonas aromaticivorans]|nr:glycoside hydrolase family 19 protein [Neopusillimonas aromaticivorans]WJJ95087.1 glycoside hydrolase family 19 protein [Neopusillimonas aromaticivorans]
MAWYPHVRAACLEYGITGQVRVAAFLAQVGHESGGFRHTREIWGPTPAQQRYEGRADLGNTEPGDGSRFRGRGLIQITGRYGYQKASKALGIDLIAVPEQLELKPMAARSAAWWWATHGCNEIADAGDFERLTRRINGALNGYPDRIARWAKAKAAL